ncbi:MAG TPA: protein translocase subunit SecD [Kofleriaceae bacterium]|nr:protein translocase subunit SecD [Kofleriaceae bacterium]
MDRSLKWRTLALLIGVLLCAGLLAPTWPGSHSLPSWFPFKKKISLGLDLQGGMHLVYTIDLGKAVSDKAYDIRRDLESRFSDEKLDAKVSTPGRPLGAVVVTMADDKKREELKSQMKADYGDTVEALDCASVDVDAYAANKPDATKQVCFEVSTSYAEGIRKSALSNAVSTIRERINERGVAEPSVVEKGDDIIVELPGDPNDSAMIETREIISNTSKLEFKVVDDSTECLTSQDKEHDPKCAMLRLYNHVFDATKSPPNSDKATDPAAAALDIRASIDQWQPEEGGAGGKRTDYYLFAFDRDESQTTAWARKHGCLFNEDNVENGKVKCRVTGRQIIERYLLGDKELGYKGVFETNPELRIPTDHEISFEPTEPNRGGDAVKGKDKQVNENMLWRTYYLDSAVRLTGSAISNAQPGNDPNNGRPVVYLDFNRYGGRVFGDLTAQIVGKKLANVLDSKVVSAPTINTAIRGGRAVITMGGSGTDVQRAERDRERLVNALRTGSLPAPLTLQSESNLGPTLGRDSIDKTRNSFIIGIILVIIIMVGVYRWSGWIAVFAVIFHIVMTLAVMAMFGATLTLPGIAAIVLSIGMEVDGNILIYERIRDELLLGKSVRGAIDLGFARAFSAILDGQLTTAAAGWVLLQYGSGPIKGFAVMLLVGVFTTLSTNIWVTRIFFDWYVSRKKGALATISI